MYNESNSALKHFITKQYIISVSGIAVMMLSALTVERHASVCGLNSKKSKTPLPRPRTNYNPCQSVASTRAARIKQLSLAALPLILYLPTAFRSRVRSCLVSCNCETDAIWEIRYYKRDHLVLLQSAFYQVNLHAKVLQIM